MYHISYLLHRTYVIGDVAQNLKLLLLAFLEITNKPFKLLREIKFLMLF